MSTASDGSNNGGGPQPRSAAPGLPGGFVVAGSPLDVAQLERLANEMFRAGPEGADLAADVIGANEAAVAGLHELAGMPAAVDGASANGGAGAPQREVLQWSQIDGARREMPEAAPAPQPDAGPVDLFAVNGKPLSLADLGLAPERLTPAEARPKPRTTSSTSRSRRAPRGGRTGRDAAGLRRIRPGSRQRV